MDLNFERAGLLLLVAAIVAILTRRLRLPYSVGLVAAGIGFALLPFTPKIELTKELLFTVLLPPLIFEAALSIDWNLLRRDFWVVTVLATLGVALAAAVTSAGMHYLGNWPWTASLMFGILISATDPVSVIAMFREAGIGGRLLLLVESESLLNDGTAAVGFAVAFNFALGNSANPAQVGGMLILTLGGSVVAGAIVAFAALLLRGRGGDHLVEITITTIAAYGSFLLAEHFQLSGVLATLTAGLILGNFRQSQKAVVDFWEYAAFVANSLVFLLIGIREAHQDFQPVWSTAVLAIVLVMLGRVAAVYPCCALFQNSAQRVSFTGQHVLVWGGLRGGLPLALALALPSGMAFRDEIITVSFAVVAFSIFVQGLSMGPVTRRLSRNSLP